MKAPVFVLVHGIYDTSQKFKVMQAYFEKEAYRCIAPSLTPNDGSKGLEYLAKQLKDSIDTETQGIDNPICLVGFSMGGLISRYYLQELKGYQCVNQFYSIATPHHGSLMAYLSGTKAAIQMRPGSQFLKELEQSSHRLGNMPCYSYWTPFDLMIVPASSSLWEQAENIRINAFCHPLMVKDKQLMQDIIKRSEQTFIAYRDSG